MWNAVSFVQVNYYIWFENDDKRKLYRLCWIKLKYFIFSPAVTISKLLSHSSNFARLHSSPNRLMQKRTTAAIDIKISGSSVNSISTGRPKTYTSHSVKPSQISITATTATMASSLVGNLSSSKLKTSIDPLSISARSSHERAVLSSSLTSAVLPGMKWVYKYNIHSRSIIVITYLIQISSDISHLYEAKQPCT